MFDRKSAMHVSTRVQDLFFIMAVSNSCMDPLVYGSYTLDMNIINRTLRKIFCMHNKNLDGRASMKWQLLMSNDNQLSTNDK
ncbi:unnamed protein product [Leptidea sinapis]|uniref:Uncharacterized protein n=1 Tax=Leptidea sinapis TaxID=189913 RepID=A0A5E4R148_9NEOP|nr:unnamed protein product [Leptidea sinapis]